MNFDKTVPEMSPDFCNRVIDASRNVRQHRPISIGSIWKRARSVMSPIRINWLVACMAAFFVIGVVMGVETYTNPNGDTMEIMEI